MEDDKAAIIPAGKLSEEIEWTPGEFTQFYFTYPIMLKGLLDFILDYIPKDGLDQKSVHIDEGKKTNITVPKLDETISSPDALLSDKSYLLIQNDSSFPFMLLNVNSIIKPENSSATLANSTELAEYIISPAEAAPYSLFVIADNKPFPSSLTKFEAGHVYSFFTM